jgi:hypothetical protein
MKPTPRAARPPRTCIEETTFAEQKARLGAGVRRLDEILAEDGLLLKIARFPERSFSVPGTSLCSELTRPFPDAPIVWLLFSYDDEAVYLRWIELY